MASYLSPGVYVKETDLTLTAPGIATSTGAIAGEFVWGPVNDLTLISNEATLVSRFGKPTNTTYKSFFSAKNFLDYSTALQVVRVSTAGQLNAVSTGTPIKISNENSYTTSFSNGEASVGMFAAKYPGELGNSLRVSMADSATYSRQITGKISTTSGSANIVGTGGSSFDTELTVGSVLVFSVAGTTYTRKVLSIGSAAGAVLTDVVPVTASGITVVANWEYADQFSAAPIDSNKALSLGAEKDGLHIVVVDEDGLFSGTPGTVLERFENASKANNAVSFDGSSSYYRTVLNTSQYVWWMDHPDTADVSVDGISFGASIVSSADFKTLKKPVTRSLTGGADVGTIATATATVGSGAVTNISVTGSGSGYTSVPTVSFSGGGGTGAAATATISNGVVTGITITNGGTSYTSAPTVTLVGGVSSVPTDGEYQASYDLFKPTDTLDISLIITGGVNKTVQQYVIQNIAETRQDAIAFVSPYNILTGNPIVGDTSESLEAIISWYNSINVSSSFGVADSGYKYQYDKYNDVYRWVPLNGDIAGVCARTDSVSETWYSPAGLSRGQIKNVTRLAYNPDKTARDELFKRNINPVVSFPGEGTVLFGDKTTLRRPSAFDAIGVRRLFIFLEKTIAQVSKYYLFEQNTDLTRQLFASTINPVLRDIKGRQGVTDFYVDIGPNVNTPDTIDAGELRANIFIKPVRSIRFVALNFIATKTSATFSTIEL